MEYKTITAVGIDVSKGKSTIAVRRPRGEVVLVPFGVHVVKVLSLAVHGILQVKAGADGVVQLLEVLAGVIMQAHSTNTAII